MRPGGRPVDEPLQRTLRPVQLRVGAGGRGAHRHPPGAGGEKRPLCVRRRIRHRRRLRVHVQHVHRAGVRHRVLGLQRHAAEHRRAHQRAVLLLLGRAGGGLDQNDLPGHVQGH